MKKNILLIAALITLAANAQTHHVDADKAQRVASNFWLWHNTTPTRSDAWDIKTITFEGFDQLHIFDFNGTGFVIVPADDRVRQVLAYSFENPFPAELNPELRYWLRNYNNQIAAIAKSDAPCHKEWERPLVDPEPDSTVDLTGVPALLTTKWNQSSPFNKFCPYDSSAHARAVVGCVATAMAQVMKYWNYPAYGEGNHTYVPHAWHGGYQYDTLSVDFENSTYLWEYMPDDLSRTAFSYQRDAVATISYHCGVAVEMMYGTSSQGGSAAYSNCGPWANACATDAFWTYFKYDTSLYYGKRDSINNDSIWSALIDEQLVLRQPMYYDGQDDEGGHAFVLDGSDTAGRYHFNMGWGGVADGFYTIDNLATDTGGIGSNATLTFNQDQGAIFDIKPAYEETFDTVDYYDTICSTSQYYDFYEYHLPVAELDTLIRHLGSYYRYHRRIIERKRVFLNPNIPDRTPEMSYFCPTTGYTLPNCTFKNEGHLFIGWCRSKTGDDTIYQPGQHVNLTSSTTFFALWIDTTGNAGIETLEREELKLWPNPTTDELNITIPMERGTLTVTDILGRVVLRDDHQTSSGETVKISLQTLSSGIYNIEIKNDTLRYNQRIIKR